MKPLPDSRLTNWIQTNRPIARAAGVSLLIFCIVAFVMKDGVGVGLLSSALLLMAGCFATISLSPLRFIKQQHVIILIAAGFILELIIF